MTTVYVVTEEFYYENTEVLAVFTDETKARAFAIEQHKGAPWEFSDYADHRHYGGKTLGYSVWPMRLQ